MSEKELNAKVNANLAARKKAAVKATVIVCLKLLMALGFFVGLKAIGFISMEFMVILALVAVCYGSFNIGRIWRD
jgi:hypothetical protein